MKKIKRKKRRKHLGITMDLFIYNPKKSISWEELDEFADEVISLIESRGWFTGGGLHLTDINGEGETWIKITPKHIKAFDRE